MHTPENKIIPACCNPPTPGGNTWPTFVKVIFRFGKLGNSGRPPGKGIGPVQKNIIYKLDHARLAD